MASTASIDDDSMDAATSDDRDLVRKACTYITEGAYIGHVQSSNYQHHVSEYYKASYMQKSIATS